MKSRINEVISARRHFAFVAFLVAVAAITLAPGRSATAEDGCVIGQGGPAHDAAGNPCAPAPPAASAHLSSIIEAKFEFAQVYAAYQKGAATASELNAAKANLEKQTGDVLPFPTPNRIAEGSQLDSELSSYWPFQQKDGNYCGPATAESMLWYLGPHTSQYSQGGETLSGNIFDDQWALGRSYYLDTNNDLETNWYDGTFVFRKAINRWRVNSDTGFYIQAAVPGVSGDVSYMNSTNGLSWIQSDIDTGYPVAGNVVYSSATYWPPDFPQSGTWFHWDNIYGHFVSGVQYVQIAQVYPAYPASRPNMFYNRAWLGNGGQWDAISSNHGIVC